MEHKAVIFDMDGVIVHTNPFHVVAFERFFDRHNISYSSEEFEEHMYGKHNGYIMRHFFKNQDLNEEEVEKLANEKEALFREIYTEYAHPISRFLEFLNELKAAGFKTGVATSAPKENLTLIMRLLGFESQMESALSSENVIHHKPHPEVYLKTMKNLAVKPENTLVFEDSFSGIIAGKNAGAKVVGVLTTHFKEQLPPCDFYIHDYTEISLKKVLELLEK